MNLEMLCFSWQKRRMDLLERKTTPGKSECDFAKAAQVFGFKVHFSVSDKKVVAEEGVYCSSWVSVSRIIRDGICKR